MSLNHYLLVTLAAIAIGCSTPESQSPIAKKSESAPVYDSLLAQKAGADAYGMRTYIMANLVAGPNRDQDSVTAANLQRAHLDNITRMAEEGTLVVAGPFMDDGAVRGIYIFAVETIEEAEALTNTDPAIQAGRLKMELRPWYGPAALMLMEDLHKKLTKKSI
ncbi:MAG: hypothetical protein CMB80_16345 [Flammeovirgaceae bacterium]|nr:hypothetical protein [Flammeovirgaceae bacterium]MBE63619.1 hypothetical protein [Flammeovirgaceae bacterium]MBR10187.1 hypothetical protein [Rickettsiales bacterium]HCX21370.1 hypothetical protein [Cytophagales bacterium]